jgi:hypothetical protein
MSSEGAASRAFSAGLSTGSFKSFVDTGDLASAAAPAFDSLAAAAIGEVAIEATEATEALGGGITFASSSWLTFSCRLLSMVEEVDVRVRSCMRKLTAKLSSIEARNLTS